MVVRGRGRKSKEEGRTTSVLVWEGKREKEREGLVEIKMPTGRKERRKDMINEGGGGWNAFEGRDGGSMRKVLGREEGGSDGGKQGNTGAFWEVRKCVYI